MKTLDTFMSELRKNADEFEAAYRKKVEESPEQYQLSIPDNNAGLWFEFFVNFVESGEV